MFFETLSVTSRDALKKFNYSLVAAVMFITFYVRIREDRDGHVTMLSSAMLIEE